MNKLNQVLDNIINELDPDKIKCQECKKYFDALETNEDYRRHENYFSDKQESPEKFNFHCDECLDKVWKEYIHD